jgi:hypothetical protein
LRIFYIYLQHICAARFLLKVCSASISTKNVFGSPTRLLSPCAEIMFIQGLYLESIFVAFLPPDTLAQLLYLRTKRLCNSSTYNRFAQLLTYVKHNCAASTPATSFRLLPSLHHVCVVLYQQCNTLMFLLLHLQYVCSALLYRHTKILVSFFTLTTRIFVPFLRSFCSYILCAQLLQRG